MITKEFKKKRNIGRQPITQGTVKVYDGTRKIHECRFKSNSVLARMIKQFSIEYAGLELSVIFD